MPNEKPSWSDIEYTSRSMNKFQNDLVNYGMRNLKDNPFMLAVSLLELKKQLDNLYDKIRTET